MQRLRRRRHSAQMRTWVREHTLLTQDLILPVFVRCGDQDSWSIDSLPGHAQWHPTAVVGALANSVALGLNAIILFGIPETKDPVGRVSCCADGVVQQAVRLIKQAYPELLCIVDLCFCQYTDHGHCGVYDKMHETVDNDASLPYLGEQAVSLAKAGADVVAPSGMLDGGVETIRTALDAAGYLQVAIMSYAVKYASQWYGPFRQAAEGAPQSGDRRGYQMDPGNGAEALLAAERDVLAGADALLIKPAMSYGDIIYRVSQGFPGVPVGAYHVSGEYLAMKQMAACSALNERAAVMEVHTGFKRAGARYIISYYTQDLLSWLHPK